MPIGDIPMIDPRQAQAAVLLQAAGKFFGGDYGANSFGAGVSGIGSGLLKLNQILQQQELLRHNLGRQERNDERVFANTQSLIEDRILRREMEADEESRRRFEDDRDARLSRRRIHQGKQRIQQSQERIKNQEKRNEILDSDRRGREGRRESRDARKDIEGRLDKIVSERVRQLRKNGNERAARGLEDKVRGPEASKIIGKFLARLDGIDDPGERDELTEGFIARFQEYAGI